MLVVVEDTLVGGHVFELCLTAEAYDCSILSKSITTEDGLFSGGGSITTISLRKKEIEVVCLGIIIIIFQSNGTFTTFLCFHRRGKISALERVKSEPLFFFSRKCANSSLEQCCTTKDVNSFCPRPSKFTFLNMFLH